jgi:hypothetical protein
MAFESLLLSPKNFRPFGRPYSADQLRSRRRLAALLEKGKIAKRTQASPYDGRDYEKAMSDSGTKYTDS